MTRAKGITMELGTDSAMESFVGARAQEQARRAAKMRAGKNRKAGAGHPTTSDPEYSAKQLEFMAAIREFQNRSGKKFPDWDEVLYVARLIGYAKRQEPSPFDAPE